LCHARAAQDFNSGSKAAQFLVNSWLFRRGWV
jgi:hypothetical protein